VRRIFVLYLELGCVRRVKDEADRAGLRTKRTTGANGAERGGKLFSRGHIYAVLSNPIYTGQIAHKDQLYPGQHPALIDAQTWAPPIAVKCTAETDSPLEGTGFKLLVPSEGWTSAISLDYRKNRRIRSQKPHPTVLLFLSSYCFRRGLTAFGTSTRWAFSTKAVDGAPLRQSHQWATLIN
jgi:hypothetical protein